MTLPTAPAYRPADASERQAEYLATLVADVLLNESLSPEQQAEVVALIAARGATSVVTDAAYHVVAQRLLADVAADPDEVAAAVTAANASPLDRGQVSEAIDALVAAQSLLTRPANHAEVLAWAEQQKGGFFASVTAKYRKSGSLTERQWSALTRAFAEATNPVAAFTAPADGTARFKKYNGEWVVLGTPEQVVPGEQVVVTTSYGTKTVNVVAVALSGEGFVLATTGTKKEAAAGRKQAAGLVQDAVADGYYAVASTGSEANDLVFVRVATDGGTTYVWQVVGGHADFPVLADRGADLLARIDAVGADVAGKTYADEFTRCYRCHRHLTDEASRAAGLGPECRKKQG